MSDAMPSSVPAGDLASIVAGRWTLSATNFPTWMSGERLDPVFSWQITSEEPLRLAHDVAYTTPDGVEKHDSGTDTWHSEAFVSRRRGWHRFVRQWWVVSGVSDDHTAMVIRFATRRLAYEGINVLVRGGVDVPELRASIARNHEQFGLTTVEFGSLSWP